MLAAEFSRRQPCRAIRKCSWFVRQYFDTVPIHGEFSGSLRGSLLNAEARAADVPVSIMLQRDLDIVRWVGDGMRANALEHTSFIFNSGNWL